MYGPSQSFDSSGAGLGVTRTHPVSSAAGAAATFAA